MSISFETFNYESNQHLFTAKQRREIERQIDGRQRKVKRLSAVHARTLNQLSQELEVVSRTSKGRRAFDTFRWDLAPEFSCHNLAELATNLRYGPEGECRSLSFHWLLSVAHEREEFALVALVALRPALERTLSFTDPSGRDEDAATDLLAAFYGLLPIVGFNTKEFLADLQRESRKGVRQRAAVRGRDSVLDGDLDPNAPAVTVTSEPDLDFFVKGLISAGLVSREDAELLLRTHLDGENLTQLALERGVAYRTLQSQRRRCEKEIRGHVRRQGLFE